MVTNGPTKKKKVEPLKTPRKKIIETQNKKPKLFPVKHWELIF
jgi:hypothetical protein